MISLLISVAAFALIKWHFVRLFGGLRTAREENFDSRSEGSERLNSNTTHTLAMSRDENVSSSASCLGDRAWSLNRDRRHFISSAAMAIAATQVSIVGCALAQPSSAERLPKEGKLPSFSGATGWLNTEPLTAANLHGKVVLVDFWTFTCVNWRRTLPYIRSWSTRYKNQGLVVIGVHTPEFSFEHDISNIRRAIDEMKIEYPVAVDSDYAIWRAFDNEYWPAIYFVDANGNIRHQQFGEGEYLQCESVIQHLLRENGASGLTSTPVSVDLVGPEVAADPSSLKTPETYVGYGESQNLVSHGGAPRDKPHVYLAPERLEVNHWALAGNWTLGKEAATLNQPNGRIAFRFHARDVNLVMGPAAQGTSMRFQVLLDGQPATSAHGFDVDSSGNGVVNEPRMYQLIRQTEPIEDRRFEIEFLDPGVQTYSFTFG